MSHYHNEGGYPFAPRAPAAGAYPGAPEAYLAAPVANPEACAYPGAPVANPEACAYPGAPVAYYPAPSSYLHAEEEAKKHKHREHMAEMGALAAGAYALYEGHEAKVDPQHAGRHKMEAEIAGAVAVAVGAAGYAMHEHHEANKYKHHGHPPHHHHQHHGGGDHHH